eukprot:gene9571-9648_t
MKVFLNHSDRFIRRKLKKRLQEPDRIDNSRCVLTITAHLYAQIRALCHKSVQGQPIEQARHELFFMARFFGSACAAASAPLFIIWAGVPNITEVAAFGFMILPLLSVVILSRTGNIMLAQIINTASMIGFASLLVAGANVPVEAGLAWLILVPIEAALMLKGAAAAITGLSVMVAVAVLYLSGRIGYFQLGELSSPDRLAFTLPALTYGIWVSIASAYLSDISRRTMTKQAIDYATLTDAIGDLIIRTDRSGAVLKASVDGLALFHLGPQDLSGRGLFERIHVADRPLYLKTISDAVNLEQTTTAILRLRTGKTTANDDNDTPVFTWVELRARVLIQQADDQQIEGSHRSEVVAVLRDVTDRVLRETENTAALLETERAGIGISPQDLTKLGKPFFQASGAHSRSHEGTGLGLSVVRGLVGLHDGRISIASAIGQGTRITIRLPLERSARQGKAHEPAKIEILSQYQSSPSTPADALLPYNNKDHGKSRYATGAQSATSSHGLIAGSLYQRLVTQIVRDPVRVVATSLLVTALVSVTINALYLQTIKHPAPLFESAAETLENRAIPSTVPVPIARSTAFSAALADIDETALPQNGFSTESPAQVVSSAQPATSNAAKPDTIGDLIANVLPKAAPLPAPNKTVLAAQRALAKLGYPIRADGVNGGTTRQAVERFERDNRLPVKGDLTPKLLPYLRRCQSEGVFAALRHRGAAEAGAIAIKIDHLDGTAALYLPAPQSEMIDGVDRMWSRAHTARVKDNAAIEAQIMRQQSFDPDLWLIEIEDRQGRHFLDVAEIPNP